MCPYIVGSSYNIDKNIYCSKCEKIAFVGRPAPVGRPLPYPATFTGHKVMVVKMDTFQPQFAAQCPWCGQFLNELFVPCEDDRIDPRIPSYTLIIPEQKGK